jgi:hypothetical protein
MARWGRRARRIDVSPVLPESARHTGGTPVLRAYDRLSPSMTLLDQITALFRSATGRFLKKSEKVFCRTADRLPLRRRLGRQLFASRPFHIRVKGLDDFGRFLNGRVRSVHQDDAGFGNLGHENIDI